MVMADELSTGTSGKVFAGLAEFVEVASGFASIISSVRNIDESSRYIADMHALRDEYFGQIPAQSQREEVRSVWQELWSRAMLSPPS